MSSFLVIETKPDISNEVFQRLVESLRNRPAGSDVVIANLDIVKKVYSVPESAFIVVTKGEASKDYIKQLQSADELLS